ncbi:helix-turn-helix domain-containing protein [Desulfurobacterium atlanticum]|uniref:Helix-turn-helix domain-containing protein n=1 Tax=Desulfurobacterium atlanticum TaxID=240169 RepID=A0A238YQP4_9BACT|nr:helix-turn-helix domain-containing protein [Desulfurobacterium atlanticum]SNR73606.1 Helix-turn-helix domain-containing protein [Desulfurobacterium atlanticum]
MRRKVMAYNDDKKKLFYDFFQTFKENYFPCFPEPFKSKIPVSARYTLMCLYSYMNHQGEAFPSMRTLSKITGYTLKTVHASIDILEQKGIISIKKHHRYNCYLIKDFSPSLLAFIWIPKDIFDYYISPLAKITLCSLVWLKPAGDEIIIKTTKELAEFMNLSSKTVRKALEELYYKDYISFYSAGRIKFPKLLWKF